MKTIFNITALPVLLFMIVILTGGQIDVAITLSDAQARIYGVLGAFALACLLMLPLAVLQFARKEDLRIHGKVATVGIVAGTLLGQITGIVGAETAFFSNGTAVALILTGMAICFASFIFGLVGHRIRVPQLAI